MSDMYAGLLHFGFRASKERLSALVQALRALDFFVLEDLRSAETLSGTPWAALFGVLDEDLEFVDDVIHKLTEPKVFFANIAQPPLCRILFVRLKTALQGVERGK